MRAVQVVTPTGPADIEVREVDAPVPAAHDVLVGVHRGLAAGLDPAAALAATVSRSLR